MKKQTKLSRTIACILVLALGISLIGCGQTDTPSAKEPETIVINIGAIQPLSGGVAAMGNDSKAAYELALDIINNKHDDLDLPFAKTEGLPNLNGAKLQIIVGDRQGSPEVAAAETERLITQQEVVMMMGSYHSSASGTGTQVAERYQIPFLIDSSSSPTLTARGFKWTFRTWPHDGIYVGNMFDYVKELVDEKNLEIKTMAIIAEDSLFGQDSAKYAIENAGKMGIQVVENISYSSNAASLDAEVQKLKAANADMVFGVCYISDSILLVKTMQKLNYVPPIFIGNNGGFMDPDFVKAVPQEGLGFVSRAVSNGDLAEKFPALGKVREMFLNKNNGRNMSDTAGGAFTAVFVVADAINRAGSTDPEEIRKALIATDIPADKVIIPAIRGVKFDPETQQNTRVQSIMIQVQDGEFVTVWPKDLRIKEPIYPIPAWNQR